MLAADRYQGGEKPAWILEIEEARATSTGAIGQSEAWAGNPRQQQQQQQKQQEEQEQQREGHEYVQEEEQEVEEHETERVEREEERAKDEMEEKAVKDEWDEDGEELRRDAAAAAAHHVSDQPMTSQQPASDVRAVTSLHATTSDDVRRVDEQPHGHVMPSPVDTDAVARHQQPVAVQSSSSSGTSAGVDERGKRRHKDDKSRRPEHSAEVSRLAQS